MAKPEPIWDGLAIIQGRLLELQATIKADNLEAAMEEIAELQRDLSRLHEVVWIAIKPEERGR